MESAALTFIVFLRWLRYQENFSPGRKGEKKVVGTITRWRRVFNVNARVRSTTTDRSRVDGEISLLL